MSSRPDSCRVAIAGSSSLLGKDLIQVLEERNFPASDLILLDESLPVGTLTEAGGEPTFIRAMTEENFERARFAFFTGSAENAARHRGVAQRAGSTVIDLSGPHAEIPTALPWIPGLNKVLPPPVSPQNGQRAAGVFSSPAPGVIIACTLASALQRFSPRRVAIVFFPPVSERDQAGVDELETQTTRLLSFQPISELVFGVQVAFNLLAGYGEESRPRLDELRAAIARETAQYIAGRATIPAIQLVQAPVFYGYAFVAYAEFDAPRDSGEIASALTAAGIRVAAGNEAPTNVSVAGESEIHMGRVEADPNISAGVWLWGVADNLRLAATNAVRIAEELLAS
jgi:aspartate-semialdehyde dehydrogenase